MAFEVHLWATVDLSITSMITDRNGRREDTSYINYQLIIKVTISEKRRKKSWKTGNNRTLEKNRIKILCSVGLMSK